jgi:hypothetical protein
MTQQRDRAADDAWWLRQTQIAVPDYLLDSTKCVYCGWILPAPSGGACALCRSTRPAIVGTPDYQDGSAK